MVQLDTSSLALNPSHMHLDDGRIRKGVTPLPPRLSSLLRGSQYSKLNKPFIVPTLDSGPTVVLPRQQIKVMYGLPEAVLNVHRVQDETMQLPWVFPDPHLRAERLQFNVIRNQLT